MPKLLELTKLFGAVLLLSALPTTSMAQGGAVDDVIQGAGGQSLRETFSNHAAEIVIREAREKAAREVSERLARQTPLPSQSSTSSAVLNNSTDLTSHGEDIRALLAKKHEDAARAASEQPNQQAAIANMRQGMDQVPQGKPREELGAAIHSAEQKAALDARLAREEAEALARRDELARASARSAEQRSALMTEQAKMRQAEHAWERRDAELRAAGLNSTSEVKTFADDIRAGPDLGPKLLGDENNPGVAYGKFTGNDTHGWIVIDRPLDKNNRGTLIDNDDIIERMRRLN